MARAAATSVIVDAPAHARTETQTARHPRPPPSARPAGRRAPAHRDRRRPSRLPRRPRPRADGSGRYRSPGRRRRRDRAAPDRASTGPMSRCSTCGCPRSTARRSCGASIATASTCPSCWSPPSPNRRSSTRRSTPARPATCPRTRRAKRSSPRSTPPPSADASSGLERPRPRATAALPAERALLQLLHDGWTVDELPAITGLDADTVERHLLDAAIKLGARRIDDTLARALARGLLD